MKLIRLSALSIAVVFCTLLTVFYASCKTDSCKGVVCQNGGTCMIDGSCQCGAYTGTRCETAKIVGTWNGVDYRTYENTREDSIAQSITIAFSTTTSVMNISMSGRHAGQVFTGILSESGALVSYTDTVHTPNGIDTLTGTLLMTGNNLNHTYETTGLAATDSFYDSHGDYKK